MLFGITNLIEIIEEFFNIGENETIDPLVIDLNNDGVIGLNAEHTVYFDMDNDGFAESVNWVGAQDGLLARDVNENGIIDDVSELFGNPLQDGFSVLTAYDLNSDQVINAGDAVWADLVVWKDANQDGYSQSDELLTLSSLGITSINLASVTASTVNPAITHNGTVTTTTGTLKISNVLFDRDVVNSRYDEDYTLDIETLFLPTLRGYGLLPDLHIAASINTSEDSNGDTIKDKLIELASMSLIDVIGNVDTVKQTIKTITYHWADHEQYIPNERFGHMDDARPLYFLEKYLNNPFMGPANLATGQIGPGIAQAAMFNRAFNVFIEKAYSDIILQIAARELFSSDVRYNIFEDRVEGNGFVLSEDVLSDLSTYAAGLVDTSARSEFWKGLAHLLNTTGIVFNGQGGMNEFGLTAAEEAKLNTAIADSDPLLVWFKEGHQVNGQFSIEFGYTAVDGVLYEGTNSTETFTGSALDDVINMRAGDDTAYGLGGNDQISGGDGTHTIYGGTGNDRIIGETSYASTGHDILYGEEGDDYIEGANGDDQIFGGDGDDELWGDASSYDSTGNDTIDGGEGNDIIYGGKGNDLIIDGYGTSGQNLLDGGDGTNTYRIVGAADVFIHHATSNNGTNIIELPAAYTDENDLNFVRLGDFLHITGSIPGQEVSIYITNQTWGIVVAKIKFDSGYEFNLQNAALNLVGYGSEGNDNLRPYYGHNQGAFYAYDDEIHGLGGDDIIDGEYGNDRLYGDGGNDTLKGRAGNDFLYGGDGNDLLEGAEGNDYLDGGAGDDVYIEYNDSDIYVANGGHDVIRPFSEFGNTSQYHGTDVIRFGAGVVLNDLLFSANYKGDLVIAYGSNSITVEKHFSHGGIDKLVFDDNSEVLISSITAALSPIHGTDLSDTIIGPTSNYGNLNSIVYAYAGNDTITTGNGTDTIYAGDGNDTVNHGGGNDVIYGGNGDDVINYGSSWFIAYGEDGNDTIYGSSGGDVLDGGAGNDFIDAGEGNNEIYSGLGHDILKAYQNGSYTNTLFLAEGIESSDLTFSRSGNGYDLLIGIDANNSITLKDIFSPIFYYPWLTQLTFSDSTTLNLAGVTYTTYGTNASQTLTSAFPTMSANIIYGYGGNDYITGGSKNDILDGGTGNDELYGASGNDTYVYSPGFDYFYTSPGEGYDIVDFGNSYTISQISLIRVSSYDLYITTNDGNGAYIYNNYLASGGDSYGIDAFKINGVLYTYEDFENDPPTAEDDDFTIAHGVSLTGNVLADNGHGVDTDENEDDLSVQAETITSAYGTLTLGTDGSVTFTPSAGYIGVANFEYTLLDEHGRSSAGNISFTITAPSGALLGNSTNDTLSGTISNDKIFGLEGNDSLTGGDGSDKLYGWSGDDNLYGGAGIDSLYGGVGSDFLSGGFAADSYYYDASNTAEGDIIEDNGDEGNDTLYFSNLQNGFDAVYSFSSDSQDLIANTEFGTLTIKNQFSSDASDRIERVLWKTEGNTSYTTMSLLSKAFVFQGTEIADNLFMPSYGLATGQSHTLYALGGNDIVSGAATRDILYGGNGQDILSGMAGDDSLYGDDDADVLYGDDGNDKLYGGSGSDSILGGSGTDSLYAGTGSDSLYGGDGADSYYFQGGLDAQGDVIEDNGASGTDTIYFDNLSEPFSATYTLSSDGLDLFITTSYGTLTVKNQFAEDTSDKIERIGWRVGEVDPFTYFSFATKVFQFDGTSGNDLINLPSHNISLVAVHTTYGYEGDDVIIGADTKDVIYGGSGNDTLSGGSAVDTLYGEDGDDWLSGGAGNDNLYGGSGADTFAFENVLTPGVDSVRDFSLSDNDKIDLSALLYNYDPLTQVITDFVQIVTSGSNSLIKIDQDGGADNFIHIATITGVPGLTDEVGLVSSGNLII